MFLYKSHAQIYILEAPLIRGMPLQCSSKTQHPLSFISAVHQVPAWQSKPKESIQVTKTTVAVTLLNSLHFLFTAPPSQSHLCTPVRSRCSTGCMRWLVTVLPIQEHTRPGGRQATHVWAADNIMPKTVVLLGVCSHLMRGASERTVTCNVPNPIKKGKDLTILLPCAPLAPYMCWMQRKLLCWGWGLGSLLTCPPLWH